MESLAGSLAKLGQQQAADELIQAALETRREKLGAEHPETLQGMHNLGVYYQDQSRYDEAEELFGELARIQERIHGKEHPLTRHSVKHLDEIAQAKKSGAAPARPRGETD